jgi:hypothetical protein
MKLKTLITEILIFFLFDFFGLFMVLFINNIEKIYEIANLKHY